ncbi:MAG: single-stranded DNA-binding protein [Gemmatimonadaceae bacterium]
MAKSLNKVQLIGNVGKDPEVRSTNNGGRVADFSLATSRQWNDAGGAGGRQEKTEWHRCVAWNGRNGAGMGLADIVDRYVKKGDKLYVEGSIEYRQWQDQSGQTRYTTEIRVRDLILLSPKGEGGGDYEGAGRARASAPDRGRTPAAASAGGDEDFEDFPRALEDTDDDLPF